MSEWIKVADRLPESDGEYIVCIEGEFVAAANYYPAMDRWYVEGELNYGITHWMPFPAPPKENNANQT